MLFKIMFVFGGVYLPAVFGWLIWRIFHNPLTFQGGVAIPFLALGMILGFFMLGIGITAIKNKW